MNHDWDKVRDFEYDEDYGTIYKCSSCKIYKTVFTSSVGLSIRWGRKGSISETWGYDVYLGKMPKTCEEARMNEALE